MFEYLFDKAKHGKTIQTIIFISIPNYIHITILQTILYFKSVVFDEIATL